MSDQHITISKVGPVEEKFQQINCSECAAPLYGVLAKAKEDKTYYVSAECPHCGDRAFNIKITGKLIFASTEYTYATPYPIYKDRTSIVDPYEPTDKINVRTEIRKKWSKK